VGAPALPFLNYAVIAGELFVALLLLCPWFVPMARGTAVLLLLLFHLLVGLLFQLGLFPWIGALLPLALLPREVWDGWGARFSQALDGRFGAVWLEEAVPPGWARARSVFLGLCLALAVLSNVLVSPLGRGFSVPSAVTGLADGLRLSQHWELFSPIPPYYGRFQLLVGGQSGGQPRVIFDGPPSREAPDLMPFPSHRWRMLMVASLYPEFGVVRAGIVQVLVLRAGVTDWNGSAITYRFQARLPNEQGRLQPPVDWNLWAKQAEPPAAKAPAASATPRAGESRGP
jgi:hypothetical protein